MTTNDESGNRPVLVAAVRDLFTEWRHEADKKASPIDHRHAMSQSEHERWNATHYPGTRQLCAKCDEPTGRCEDDSMFASGEHGPLCENCWEEEEQKG